MRGRHVDLIWPSNPTLYAPARHRRACRYQAWIPDPIAEQTFSLDSRTAGIVSDAERAIASLNATVHPGLAPLSRLLLRTESIASSRVEGMSCDLRTLARAEAGARTNQTTMDVLANVNAMQLAVDDASAADAFTVDHIMSIHRRLMTETSTPHIAGRLRTTQNWIGGNDFTPCGADYVPPPPEHVIPLLHDVCQAVQDEMHPPVVQAALVHAQFETIHPFDDGNGRTGRALIHVVLRRRGLAPGYVPPISLVFAAHRERYIRGLTQFRDNQVAEWVDQFAGSAASAVGLAQKYLRAVHTLTLGWRERLSAGANPRIDAAAWALIDILPAYPVITAPLAAAATGRAKAAVHQALGELVSAGVLLPLSLSKRNRSWEASGLLDVLARLEGHPGEEFGV